MKHYLSLCIFFTSVVTGIFASDGDILFHIDNEPVSVSEFEYIYNKNNFNNKADYSEASLREYLNLYINFRLKVKEAEALGLDEDTKLLSELKVYQEQLYNSFFEREKMKILVDEAMERTKHDIHISHIFVSVSKEADDITMQPKLDKINRAYNELEGGKSFNEVAKLYSEDKYTRDEGGDLAYYTALQIAYYPLESAAYNTPVGTYSKPVRTDLGFHIVKVNDKRPARGLVKASVIKINKKKTDADGNELKTLMQKLYDELLSGANFSDYAHKYSEDPSTKTNGGEMDWFGIAQYNPMFEDAVFNLKENGEISSPFDTKDAWYIVKLEGRKAAAASEEDRELITKKVKQSDRYKLVYNEHVQGVLDQYGFEIVQPGYNNFKAVYTSDPESLKTYLTQLDNPKVLAKIAGINFTEADLGKYIKENIFKYRRLDSIAAFNALFNDFKRAKAVDFHIIEYGKENKEYGSLLNEYRDGILLFELMETNVWSRAVSDTSGLRKFFNNHRENFKNPESASVRVFEVNSSKEAAFLSKALKSSPELSDVSWLSKLNKKGISSNYKDMLLLKSDALASKLTWSKGVNTITENETWKIYQVIDIKGETLRSFDESKGFAIAEYQEHLEKGWISELREKYSIKVDEGVLMQLVK